MTGVCSQTTWGPSSKTSLELRVQRVQDKPCMEMQKIIDDGDDVDDVVDDDDDGGGGEWHEWLTSELSRTTHSLGMLSVDCNLCVLC